jgi:hypothetical protein
MAACRSLVPRRPSHALRLLASAGAAVLLLSRCATSAGGPPAAGQKRAMEARSIPSAETRADSAPWNVPSISGRGFTLGPDVRVFAVFAYLNSIGGYEAESEPSMDPLRQRMRSDLRAALRTVDPARLSHWRSFAAAHPAAPSAYLSSALTVGMPPEFRSGSARDQLLDPSLAAGVAGFQDVLPEFWKHAGLERLYREFYREEIARQASSRDPAQIASLLAFTQGYLRLIPENTARVSLAIIANPFDSHSARYAVRTARTLYIIEGPGTSGQDLGLQEYLHYFVDPVVEKAAGTRSQIVRDLVTANRAKPLVRGIREDAAAFVSECLVRALDHRIEDARKGPRDPGLLDRLWQRMKTESEEGLALVPLFFAELPRYEMDEGMSLALFVDSALVRLEK